MTRFCDNLYGILLSSKKEDKVQEVIKSIKTKVSSITSNQIPRSISLLEYFWAILVEAEIIILPLDKYYFHRTSELLALYPIFQDSGDLIFEYEL
jgi:hypothetical protein